MTYLGPVPTLEYIHIDIFTQTAFFETASAIFLRANSQLSLVFQEKTRAWVIPAARTRSN
jgi:hypothetical protein